MALILLLAAVLAQDPGNQWSDHPEADAIEYSIEIEVDPVAKRAEAVVDYWFRADEELRYIRLDSLPGENWQVTFEDLKGEPLPAERHGDELWVRFPRRAAEGAEIRFRARLSGTPPDGLYFNPTRYGEPCAYTDHFPARARGWLPCEDAPGDRARFRLKVTAPEGFQVIGTGTDADEDALLPTYLLAFSAAPYVRVHESGDERLIDHFIYSKDVEAARKSLRYHAEWMKLMEEYFGPYPYNRYTTVQVPTRWGGMENAGNTWLAEGIFDFRGGGVGTLAHEFAHMWFGDGVGYRDWDHVWLSEGFASYFGPWLHSKTGGPQLAESMDRSRRNWRRSREGRMQPVIWGGYTDPGQVLNSNTYPKGAWVLHMLRNEIGDDAFFAGIREYYASFANRAVDTASLRRTIEKHAKRDLGWFFEQWLERPNCPELTLNLTDTGVTVMQMQEGPAFRFPLTLEWKGEDGEVRRQSFRISEVRTDLELEGAPMAAKPRIDPAVELLFRDAF